MEIANNAFVSIDYVLTIDSGEEVDRSESGSPLGFVFGCGMLIPGLEKQMLGMKVGDKAKLDVEANEAYGPHDPELMKPISKNNFPADVALEPGMVFQGQGPHGPVAVRIASVENDHVMADFNHPLAGKALTFEITVTALRPPSDEELEHAIRQIVSKAVVSDEVVDIFAAAGLKKPDISILSDEFLAEVRGMPQRNLAVELLQKLLKGEIRER